MRRLSLAVVTILVLAPACALGRPDAMRSAFEGLDLKGRQTFQLWLIAAGDTNVVPTEHFSKNTAKAIAQFQVENGYSPTGSLDKAQIERLVAVADAKLSLWGLRKVTFPGRAATVWVPFGLGLDARKRSGGYHYEDAQGRLSLDLLVFPRSDVAADFSATVAGKKLARWDIHYSYLSLPEGWFVLSATSPDGHDHYYRYHQDGDAVIGFALEWDNSAGNVSAERIAVIDSAVLGASMKGAFFIDPPGDAVARDEPPPERQPAARPVERAPEPPKKDSVSTGTGFFVSADGHFVTNAHVVADCSKVVVKTDDGTTHEAARTATDQTNDLAILKLDLGRDAAGEDIAPKRVASLRIGTRLGEGVEAFGFPHADLLASSGNFTLGNVTALSGIGDDSRYLQISAPVQAGNSGGPLLDGSGNVVGVVSAKLDAMKVASASGDLPQNVNFAVKSAVVATFLDANRVTYKTGAPGGTALQPADIADAARAMSGFVVCR